MAKFSRRRVPGVKVTPAILEHLRIGQTFFVRFDEREKIDEDTLRRAWADQATQEEVFRAHYARHGHRCTRPWAWWQFDSPEPRDKRIGDEAEQLRRMGELSEADMDALYRLQDAGRDAAKFREFDRPISWWWRHAPEPRDYSEPEAVQLERLGLLTDAEARLLRTIRENPRPYGHLFARVFPPGTWHEVLGYPPINDETRRP